MRRMLDAEQAARRDKIAAFVRRVQAPPVPPEPAPSRESSKISSRGSAAVDTGAGRNNIGPRSCDLRGPAINSAKQAKGVELPRTRQLDTASDKYGPSANPRADQKAPSQRTAGAPRDDKHSRYSDSKVQYDDELYSEDEFEPYDGDKYMREHGVEDVGDELERSDEPPPSYDALMRASMESRQSRQSSRNTAQEYDSQPGQGDSSLPVPPVTGSTTGMGPREGRRTVFSAGPNRPPVHAQPARTLPVGPSAAEPAHMSLEERAAARRERTLLLRRQAEERVQEKAQQKTALERWRKASRCCSAAITQALYFVYCRQRIQREAEEAEAVRKEARCAIIKYLLA
jgi:hypothetical protein